MSDAEILHRIAGPPPTGLRGAGTIYWAGRSFGKRAALYRLDVAMDERADEHARRWLARLGLRGLGLGLAGSVVPV